MPKQLRHRLRAMVSRDVIAHIEPDALDVVVVASAGREKVQLDAVVHLGEGGLGLPALVDEEVVADEGTGSNN